MWHEVRTGGVGEGKLPLSSLLQGHTRRHTPAIVRDGYGARAVDAAGDEWGRLQRDIFVESVAGVDFEDQVVHRRIHLPKTPQPTPIDERRQNPLGHDVVGPDACGIATTR